MNCHNCGKVTNPPHKAINCPEPPSRTRCPSCFTVALTEHAHKHWCANRTYRSQILESTVVRFDGFFQLDLQSERDFVVKNGERDITIGSSIAWMTRHDCYIRSTNGGRSLLFFDAKPKDRCITILNQNEGGHLSIDIGADVVTVNNRYSLYRDGWVSFNQFHPNCVTIENVCAVKLGNIDELLKVRLNLLHWGMVYKFNGAILQDSLLTVAIKSAENVIDDNSIVQMSNSTENSQFVNDSSAEGPQLVEVSDFLQLEFM